MTRNRITRFTQAVCVIGLGVLMAACANAPAFAAALEPSTIDGLLSPDNMLWIGLGGMLINQQNLGSLFTGYQTAFNAGRMMAAPMHDRIATTVPSTTREELYAWLGKIPGFRKWVGDRVIQNLSTGDYTIINEPYENTIGVDRDDIEDDRFGVYGPLFQELGMNTAAHPSELLFALLKLGFTQKCFDGQFFFDTDHPVLDAAGATVSVANTDGGAGTPWFLMDVSRALKPLIWQMRRPYDFKRMDDPNAENVFMRKEFVYGTDARVAAGFGLWQLAWGSKQTLNKANYKIAREAMMSLKADYGQPMAVRPTLLVHPPSLEGEALEILNSERDAAGATNVYKGTAERLNVPWLA